MESVLQIDVPNIALSPYVRPSGLHPYLTHAEIKHPFPNQRVVSDEFLMCPPKILCLLCYTP